MIHLIFAIRYVIKAVALLPIKTSSIIATMMYIYFTLGINFLLMGDGVRERVGGGEGGGWDMLLIVVVVTVKILERGREQQEQQAA